MDQLKNYFYIFFRGHYYDNVFLHYRPRELWYSSKDAVLGSPISREAVFHSQRNLGPTNWEAAWDDYSRFLVNNQMMDMGLLTSSGQGVALA